VKPTRPSLFARVRGWVGRPLGRGVLALSGLVVLSLVGRFAVAGGQASPVAVTASAAELVPSIASLGPMNVAATLPVVDASTAPAAATHGAHATEDDPVYLNDATVDDLRRLPGVGEKRALAILELRRKLGRFKQIEDLLRVKGIGRATLRRLRPLVRIDRPSQGGEGGVP
jgi:competence protein ComEA